jgi:amino acid transporter
MNFGSDYNNEPDDDEWFTPNTTGAANQVKGNQGNDEEEKLSDNDAMAIGICAIIAVILIYIFRKKIYEFIMAIMPLVVLIVILAVVIKLVFFGGKKKEDNSQASRNYERGGGGNGYSERESDGANWHFEFKMSNVLTCAIFWFIGFGGMANGAAENTGSLVIALILIVLGFLAIYRKN